MAPVLHNQLAEGGAEEIRRAMAYGALREIYGPTRKSVSDLDDELAQDRQESPIPVIAPGHVDLRVHFYDYYRTLAAVRARRGREQAAGTTDCGARNLFAFNLFPIPPLDGGRIAVGVLPQAVASLLARLEPYGMLILIGLLFILPMLGAQLGIDLNVVSRVIANSTSTIIDAILRLTGNM